MLNDLINNGIPAWVLLVVAAGLFIYAVAAIWTHISVGRLLWQNLFRANKVELPRLGRSLPVLPAGVAQEESTALVLSRARLPLSAEQPATRDFTNLIYPIAGRNGLHFAPDRCTGCGLCVYVCPTGAITTHEQDKGYVRRFNLAACVYCGLCEAACPTSAIRLTFKADPAQPETAGLLVEGLVETTPCRKCKRLIPQPDLMAERIYAPPIEAVAEEEAAVRYRQTINPDGLCLECQKKVMEAEEKV